MYFTHQNIMQSGDPMELNFEGLEMRKWNVPTDRVQVADKKWGHSYGSHVYSRRSFSCTFMLFSKFDKCFCCQQQKIQKSTIFDILITITLEVNMITQQMDLFFFSSTLWALLRWFISTLHFKRLSKFNFKCSLFALCSGL